MVMMMLIYVSIYIGLFMISFYVLSYFSNPPKKFPKIADSKLPTVSIIVPAWNEEKGIGKTLESLQKIDYPKDKLEIIVVDDGSTDNTYKEALKYQNDQIKVFRKDVNGGKFTALNFGIKKAKSEFIVSTDADNLEVMPDALKYMVRYFEDPIVMCVAPAMAISNPKGILARVQQVEYLIGVFLRKVFANINTIHVTPGAFSAYRKSFIEKYGGFKRAHLTEDMEMSLRIQKYHYKIENSIDSMIYTPGFSTFIGLLRQRRRWYVGSIRNYYDYKGLISFKYGLLGTLIIPMTFWTIFTIILFNIYTFIKTFQTLKEKIIFYESINFDIFHFEFSSILLKRAFLIFSTTPLMLFSFIFIIVLLGYMMFAKRWVHKNSNIKLSVILFILFYSPLSLIWWIDSIIHSTILFKRVKWR
jgi:cellulose synthase/poly-beta-1,6-N-acetylglucosamine synthase-like glycosyltransferase